MADPCRARRLGKTASIPQPRRRRSPPRLSLALARVERDGRLLLLRGLERGLFARLWQLPGVEVSGSEDARSRLRRALLASFGVGFRVGRELATVERDLTHRRLVLRVFRCEPGCRIQHDVMI